MGFGLIKSLLLLFLLLACIHFTVEDVKVNPTLLRDKGAVCLSGLRAAYYFASGSGDGVENWLVFLPGGGWCSTPRDCQAYIPFLSINETAKPFPFTGILSNNKVQNPDFFNWNKVVIRYCDGSSFTGNSKKKYNGTNLYFRGAKIYKSAMKEILKKGMRFAKKALLVGESAGGVATAIHCDNFRDQFSKSTRVKCLSDAGYFFPAKKHNLVNKSPLISIFEGLITLHKSTQMLPKSCTSNLNPAMCFFAQNVQEYIKTPIFFIMSEFDPFEIGFTTGSMDPYVACIKFKNCTTNQIDVMQDLRLNLLDVLPEQNNCSSRGFLIVSVHGHEHTTTPQWYHPTVDTNETMSNLFGDWYYNRRIVQVIDKCDHPYGCN